MKPGLEVSAASRIAGSSAATFGASLFKTSPVWRSVERQQRMLDQVSKAHATLATAAFSSQAKRISQLVASPAFNQVTDLVTNPAFTLATEQLANEVRPALEKALSHHEKIGEVLSSSALANLEALNQHLAEDLFNTRILADEAFMQLAATTRLGSHLRLGLEGAFQEVLRRVPELDSESGDEDDVPDQVLSTPASTSRNRLLTHDEWMRLLRAWWVMFVVAQELTPEGRMFRDEFAVILTVITAIVFWYPPRR